MSDLNQEGAKTKVGSTGSAILYSADVGSMRVRFLGVIDRRYALSVSRRASKFEIDGRMASVDII